MIKKFKKNLKNSVLFFMPIVLFLGAGYSFKFNNEDSNSLLKNDYNKKVSDLKLIDMGKDFSGAVFTDSLGNDHLYTWGYNINGQLGHGNKTESTENSAFTKENEVSLPIKGNIKDISFGFDFSLLVMTDEFGQDHIFSCGSNSNGQLGLGDEYKNYTKQENGIPNFTEIKFTQTSYSIKEISFIDASISSSFLIGIDNFNKKHLFSWGSNNFGQLGLGDTNDRNIPTEVVIPQDLKIKHASMGHSSSMIVLENNDETNSIYTSGEDFIVGSTKSFEKLDFNDFDETNFGTIKDIDVYSSIDSYVYYCVSQDANNREHLYTWGNNNHGQLGLGNEFNGVEEVLKPTEVIIDSSKNVSITDVEISNYSSEISGKVTSIVSVNNYSKIDSLYSWGYNLNGQLGLGDANNSLFINSPKIVCSEEGKINQISIFEDSVFISFEDNFGLDHLFNWGSNEFGELGYSTFLNEINEPIELISNNLFNFEIIKRGKIKLSLKDSIITNERFGQNFTLYGTGIDKSGISLNKLGIEFIIKINKNKVYDDWNIKYEYKTNDFSNEENLYFLPFYTDFKDITWIIVLSSVAGFILLVSIIAWIAFWIRNKGRNSLSKLKFD